MAMRADAQRSCCPCANAHTLQLLQLVVSMPLLNQLPVKLLRPFCALPTCSLFDLAVHCVTPQVRVVLLEL